MPPRILRLAKYGGLNVHPSILPEYSCVDPEPPRPRVADADRFRGPAPLHHTLLQGRQTTGVTLQTLHPTDFDKGDILDQTPYPGIEHGAGTVEELRELLAPIGARMLARAIKDRSFVPPIDKFKTYDGDRSTAELTYASKIGPKDRHIDWTTWTAGDILRRQQVIGPLWNIAKVRIKDGGGQREEAKRIIWDQGFRILKEECHLFPARGQPIIVGLHGSLQELYIRTCDGNMLVADEVKIEGQNTTVASHAARRNGLAAIPSRPSELREFPHDFVAFHSALT